MLSYGRCQLFMLEWSMANASPTFSPLYQQIKSLILQALEAGEWAPGQAIPSEQDLAARFSVSQGTVRKAIDELSAENIVLRRQGKGTFVASHHDPRASFRFLRLVPLSGGAGQPRSFPLECWKARAGQEASKNLHVPLGSPIIIVRRLLKFDVKPVVVDEIYLPGEMFQGLTLEVLQDWEGSLYSLFETRFGLRMIPRVGAYSCRGGGAAGGRIAGCCRAHAVVVRGTGGVHLRRQAGGVAAWPVFHRRAFLPERAELIDSDLSCWLLKGGVRQKHAKAR